jgi:hypothetical protein
MVASTLKHARHDRPRIRPVIAAWAVAAGLFVGAGGAQAQSSSLGQREAEARRECLLGNVQRGVEGLTQLYVETENVNYLYNQARCYEQNGKPDEAILRFREYLRKLGNPPAEEKADVERHIADCQAMKAEQAGSAPSALPEPPTIPAVPVPAETAAPAPSPGPSETLESRKPETPTNERGSTLRTAGIVTAAIGGATLVTGIVFSLETRSIRNEVSSDNSRQTYDRNKDDRGRLFSNLQWVGYGVGGAALAGGAVLYYLGYRAGQSSAPSGSLSLVPMASPGLAGALLVGSY